MADINVMGDKCLLKEVGGVNEYVRESGLITIEMNSEENDIILPIRRYEVVKVGTKVSDISVGDHVAVRHYLGTPVRHEFVDYVLIREDDIEGIY